MTIAPRMRVLSPKEVCQTCWLAPCEQPGWLSTWLLGWLRGWLRLQVRSPGFGDKPRVWRQAAGLKARTLLSTNLVSNATPKFCPRLWLVAHCSARPSP